MTPDVVVDIGNTRMKWGVCLNGRVTEVLRLPLDDTAVWDGAAAKLPPAASPTRKWAAASVNPPALHRFVAWSQRHGEAIVFEKYTGLPIPLNVDVPGAVGLDRLFGAVGARALAPARTPVITVDVGTAVTINLVDADGVFQGGAIFPGPRLMARALHEFTAKLPLAEPTDSYTDFQAPAKNTAAAIRAGILAALGGGVVELTRAFADRHPGPWMFVTGGGGHLLSGHQLPWLAEKIYVPALTLEGIRIAAGALP